MNNKFTMSLAAAMAFAALALPSHQALAKSHTVTCTDGTSSAAGRGACSGHGGVAKAAKHVKAAKQAKTEKKVEKKAETKKEAAKETKKEAKKEPKKEAKKAAPAKHAGSADSAGATAKCKDGTYSHAKQHKGACSKHGGVAEWMGH